jgi:hypothetical protein
MSALLFILSNGYRIQYIVFLVISQLLRLLSLDNPKLMKKLRGNYEVWCQLYVSKKSTEEIHKFFRDEYNLSPELLIKNLHLTIYHCRRPMPSLEELNESCHLYVDTLDTRFMVLAPGGENSKPSIIPSLHKIGIRIKKASDFRAAIDRYRNSAIKHENHKILKSRLPSTKTKSAFGARSFQPHIAIIKSGNGLNINLLEIGTNFRDFVQEIKFDRFVITKTKTIGR